ncbi:MAG: DNA polymerase III subunit gamma/tau [Phycisphaerae bacterium]|nr:DNA polymerase III subunit gamma/tau [Phycisphaerae bacterium]
MAYTVLARKYRSRTFDEVIGQEPISTTLVNAIKVGRIHHGYLFTGTRGVGKTSMARILAKALNCLKFDAPTTTPCCECDACVMIAEGQDVDVLEIDAASNTGVDNIRELRSNTAYRPARSRYKVYIIDEVHMLSTGAFNALLKTLEEPPDHVKFILATTEIQKVPATIQSRCQRFNFRNISPDAIARRMAEIAKEEGAQVDNAVVQRVARLAMGSMRDGLSILDQLLSVSPKKLTAKILDELLPPAQDERVFALLQHAAAGEVAEVLTDLDGLVAEGRGLENFCNDVIAVVRALLLVSTCGPDAAMVDLPAGARDDYVELSKQFELSHYVQMIAMLEELRRSVRYSGAGRALTEALLVRLARMRAWTPIEKLLGQLPATSPADAEKKKRPASRQPIAAGSGSAAVAPPRDTGFQPVECGTGFQPVECGTGFQPVKCGTGFQPVERGTGFQPVVPPDENQYRSETAEPDDHQPSEDGVRPPADEAVWKEATPEEQARVKQDPVVRQTLDLFDGTLIAVKSRAAIPGQ